MGESPKGAFDPCPGGVNVLVVEANACFNAVIMQHTQKGERRRPPSLSREVGLFSSWSGLPCAHGRVLVGEPGFLCKNLWFVSSRTIGGKTVLGGSCDGQKGMGLTRSPAWELMAPRPRLGGDRRWPLHGSVPRQSLEASSASSSSSSSSESNSVWTTSMSASRSSSSSMGTNSSISSPFSSVSTTFMI